MRHPNEGLLRRVIDEPNGVSTADRAHIASCRQCLDQVAVMQRDAALVGAALAADEKDIDVAAAWNRLGANTTVTVTPITAAKPRKRFARKSAIAAVAVGAILVGGTAAAANNWFQIFKTEQVAAVNFDPSQLLSIPDLRAYGDFTTNADIHPHEVPTAQAAATQSGLQVPTITDLPRGVSGDPAYQVLGKTSATFTFNATRAAAAVAQAGKQLPPPPPGLDGSTVRLEAGPGVAEVWSKQGIPTLVIGRAVAPTAYSTGVSFNTIRDYLVSIPGFPSDVADQLRAFSADGSTLPIPVPEDRATTEATRVNGIPATLVQTRDQSMTAVIWVDNGIVNAVAGSLGSDEVIDIAAGLK